jgi:transcriptional regulator with PAS, ATPase and Fis domain
MKEVLRIARAAARSSSTVLLLGESGTGKEVVARAIHNQSARRDQPFIAVNCVALAPSLLESELFGHEKGAFTGATHRKKGKFELAAGGTLFLDEIGDLAPNLQTKLLRALQEREVERVGGEEPIRVDVRVLAATNRDLQAAMRGREFREDLFYRLNVITLTIPPLSERPEDIRAMCTHFLMRACQAVKKPPMRLSDEALAALEAYAWPGNVRELANMMERLAVLTDARVIAPADLPAEISGARALPEATGSAPRGTLSSQLRAVKERAIRDALAAADANQTRAAALLGVKQSNLSRMMKSLGLR